MAGPALQFSQVLTDDDFVAVINEAASSGHLAAISWRDSLAEDVSDALAGTHDISAIATLLANGSVEIREENWTGLSTRRPGFLKGTASWQTAHSFYSVPPCVWLGSSQTNFLSLNEGACKSSR